MPWTVDDVDKHNKGLSDHEKRQWVEVANSSLERGDDDGTAITKANGVVKRNRVVESILYTKATSMIEAVVMQEIASIFEWKKESLDNEPEGILKKHGWKSTHTEGDRTIYTHHRKKGHEIHVAANGGWRHYDGDRCLHAGFTGEKIKKHLGESVDLMEADPRPRVEKDINGKPVVPNKAQYHQYFSDMHHEHIKSALSDAKKRWAAAAKDHEAARVDAHRSKEAKEKAAHAAAHLKAVGAEISAGHNVLRLKQRKLKKKKTVATKKIKQQSKGNQGLVKAGTTALFGKSKMASSVAKHISHHFLQGKLDKLQKVKE
jgi:hypothetical protein